MKGPCQITVTGCRSSPSRWTAGFPAGVSAERAMGVV